MIINIGQEAVDSHCEEAGIAEDVKKLCDAFSVTQVAIFTPGKLTYTGDRPSKSVRIVAHPKPEAFKGDLETILKSYRDKAKKR